MSLQGTANPGQFLTGKINKLTYQMITAYGIAVKNGFEGTEEEWLASLAVNPDAVEDTVREYLTENPVAVDTTLSVKGMAAEAKTTGDALASLGTTLTNGLNAVGESVANLDEAISATDSTIASIGADIARLDEGISDAANHIANKENPHGVTVEQIGAAEASHEHSADNITSGVLPIARGGTGATKAADALANLGALSKAGGTITGTLYINNTTDGSSTADNNVGLIVGNRSGDHIIIDTNEIIPKKGAKTGGSLMLGDSQATVTMNGIFALRSSYSYGTSLPTAGQAGRVFFKKV